MLRLVCCLMFFTLPVPLLLAESRELSLLMEGEEDSSLAPLSEEERREELAFTQSELYQKFDRAYALDIGPVMPWNRLGLSLQWKAGPAIDTVQAGLGDFKISGNEKNRNYQISVKTQVIYYSKSYHLPVLTPLYLEPFAGWVHWNGDIQPRGEDQINDEIASSLSSGLDVQGLQLGANLGVSWIFSNSFFVDYKLMSLSGAYLLQQRYTYNTSEARDRVRDQLQGPLAMNTMHLRLGYAILL